MNYTKKVYNNYIVIIETPDKISDINNKRSDNPIKSLKSLQRARRNILEIFEYNLHMNDLVITLTYKDNIIDYETSRKHFDKFIKRMRYKYGSFEYLAIQEKQKRGALHYHIILFLYSDSKEIYLKDIIKIWGLGRCDLDLVDENNYHALPFYFSKYVTDLKKGQVIDANKRFYNTSRGVIRPKKEKITQHKALKKIKNDKNIQIRTKKYIKYVFPLEK